VSYTEEHYNASRSPRMSVLGPWASSPEPLGDAIANIKKAPAVHYERLGCCLPSSQLREQLDERAFNLDREHAEKSQPSNDCSSRGQ